LAVAALAAVGVAVLRSVNAAERSKELVILPTEAYAASPAEQTATLAKLRAPHGFGLVRCPGGFVEASACFHNASGALLSNAEWLKLVAATGATPLSSGLPTGCIRPRHNRLARVGGHIQVCDAQAVIGREHLIFDATSFEPGRPTTEPLAAKYQREALTVWGRGTVVRATVLGHLTHRG
jgi:hypothetical protein